MLKNEDLASQNVSPAIKDSSPLILKAQDAQLFRQHFLPLLHDILYTLRQCRLHVFQALQVTYPQYIVTTHGL